MSEEPFGELAAFGRELRAAGLTVGSGQVTTYCRALAATDPTRLTDLYWVGRVCLTNRQADLAVYDDVFSQHFLAGRSLSVMLEVRGELPPREVVGFDLRGLAQAEERSDDEPPGGRSASAIEILRDKDFSQCTPEELEALRDLMSAVLFAAPEKRVRRTERARAGERLDLRRALREAIRTDGDVFLRRWRRRRTKPRTLVLLLDVSGSMSRYSRALLQFAHTAERGRGRVEVFCFGTRLTRVTDELAVRDPDAALAAAAARVLDWEGGTLIGSSIATYTRRWGRRGGFRGAVVIICSDGLERGDPAVLAGEMARLRRLAHRVVWVNPLKTDERYRPETRGIRAALPHVDALVAGHNLASLHELANILPALN